MPDKHRAVQNVNVVGVLATPKAGTSAATGSKEGAIYHAALQSMRSLAALQNSP
jgi:hypothetical protein